MARLDPKLIGQELMRQAQSGGSPYDEDNYMEMSQPSSANEFLNSRLDKRIPPVMFDYMTGGVKGMGSDGMGYAPRSRFNDQGGGVPPTDMNMMLIYGPEDQVAYDSIGRPIPLNDPRHPRNQQQSAPSYPQRP
jgi:hypothetical protein